MRSKARRPGIMTQTPPPAFPAARYGIGEILSPSWVSFTPIRPLTQKRRLSWRPLSISTAPGCPHWYAARRCPVVLRGHYSLYLNTPRAFHIGAGDFEGPDWNVQRRQSESYSAQAALCVSAGRQRAGTPSLRTVTPSRFRSAARIAACKSIPGRLRGLPGYQGIRSNIPVLVIPEDVSQIIG
jgi:hypothetical protein